MLVAFLKGHMGVVDYLLDQPGVELCADSPPDAGTSGRTLAMRLLRSRLGSSVFARLQFLLERQSSDAKRADSDGNNAVGRRLLLTVAGKLGRNFAKQSLGQILEVT